MHYNFTKFLHKNFNTSRTVSGLYSGVHISSLGQSNGCMDVSITVQQDASIYSLLYFCKLLYICRVVNPPIIRSTYNCNYSIWHWSNRLCYLPLWWRSWNAVPTSPPWRIWPVPGTVISYMCSWWWVEIPPETCRAVYRNIINCM
jgi:hypothetical protein